MRVIVIGAGIGGLTLAQGLRREGVDVSVHDRDARPSTTGGYRLHLGALARDALARRLPAALWQAVLASSAGGASFRRFTFGDHRMRVLISERQDDGERVMIGRIPLRELLCHDLGDALHFGSEFTGHRVGRDGSVTAEFADGSTDEGHVLVGADGVGSRVVTRLAGARTDHPTGIESLAGRVPLDRTARALVPAQLWSGPALAIGPGGVGAFLTLHDPVTSMIVDPATCTTVPARTEDPYLLWAPGLPADGFPVRPEDLDGSGLVGLGLDLFRGWDPAFRELVARTDPSTVAHFRFRAANPDADPTPWPAGTVTALGDAVHAMPPTGGRGASTAIRDADVLTRHLLAARDGVTTTPLALHAFEEEMGGYAPDAVRESLRPLAWQRRLSGRLAYPLGRAALAAAGTRSRHRDRTLQS
ncbi:NAD(P)/FAD-dependent oxidoreductase [Pseudonocardia sp. KRD291]|uniref:FAD-dependent oxidoreductase n=1 Tax=Pseudonocardia sp. KRD291 TaxID=2792007 RepID=UPI001C4A41A2|nr:NAD(P)/FAD-dependent oxidoreductase [Pseudonocardia sp. KRD291]MBW0104757.1 FAD-dependent monooxygenase [Pseudonocardia sp. KRD291]